MSELKALNDGFFIIIKKLSGYEPVTNSNGNMWEHSKKSVEEFMEDCPYPCFVVPINEYQLNYPNMKKEYSADSKGNKK